MGDAGAYKDLGDAELLRSLKDGSMEAFNALYQRYWQPAYNAAFKRLNDPAAAQDVTQDIFLQLWNRRADLHILHLPAYIHTSVRNRVLNLLESQQRFLPMEDLFAESASGGEGADALARRNQWLKSYHALVDALPPGRQEIFRMRYNEGATPDQIAAHLNISRKTVQNQLGKALARLRASLGAMFWSVLP